MKKPTPMTIQRTRAKFTPDHRGTCENCGSSPTVPMTGLCGPCHFGTADAVGGGWWNEGTDDFDEDFVEEHL